jgi:hypothetical protein
MLYPGVPQSVQDVTGLGRFIKGLLVQYHAQERSVDLKSAVVLDEAQFPELVHEEIDARACCANHLGQRFLRHLGENSMGLVLFAVLGKQ